ncbi:protein of unknown function [Nitrospira japonica]|uniref:Uncharacterized protein n=1 Tax=Nitrospira japonica TaxID=1325564 RepID=A0A1W1I868_9BACT|nr:protein of unknown function [Nitrospira japonica]
MLERQAPDTRINKVSFVVLSRPYGPAQCIVYFFELNVYYGQWWKGVPLCESILPISS